MIKRYNIEHGSQYEDDTDMVERENGQWVKFEDVEQMLKHPLLKFDIKTGEVTEVKDD